MLAAQRAYLCILIHKSLPDAYHRILDARAHRAETLFCSISLCLGVIIRFLCTFKLILVCSQGLFIGFDLFFKRLAGQYILRKFFFAGGNGGQLWLAG